MYENWILLTVFRFAKYQSHNIYFDTVRSKKTKCCVLFLPRRLNLDGNCMGTMVIAINRRWLGTKRICKFHPIRYVPNVCASANAFFNAHYIRLDNPSYLFLSTDDTNISVAVSQQWQLLRSVRLQKMGRYFFDISTAWLHFIQCPRTPVRLQQIRSWPPHRRKWSTRNMGGKTNNSFWNFQQTRTGLSVFALKLLSCIIVEYKQLPHKHWQATARNTRQASDSVIIFGTTTSVRLGNLRTQFSGSTMGGKSRNFATSYSGAYRPRDRDVFIIVIKVAISDWLVFVIERLRYDVYRVQARHTLGLWLLIFVYCFERSDWTR